MEADDFKNGQVLLIDKPLNWTSFQVVNKLRWAIRRRFGIKKIKVGHAGTLDPLATGLLVICTGKKTKTIAELQAQTKEYTGTIRLGATTPSFDLETEIDQSWPTEHITEDKIREAARTLTGFICARLLLLTCNRSTGFHRGISLPTWWVLSAALILSSAIVTAEELST